MKLISFCFVGGFSIVTLLWRVIEFTHTAEFVISLSDARIIRWLSGILASRAAATAVILLLATLSVLLLANLRAWFIERKSMRQISAPDRGDVSSPAIVDETEEIETETQVTFHGIKKSSKIKRTKHRM